MGRNLVNYVFDVILQLVASSVKLQLQSLCDKLVSLNLLFFWHAALPSHTNSVITWWFYITL